MISLPVFAVLVAMAFSASMDQNKMLEIVKMNFLKLDDNKDNHLDAKEFMGYYHKFDANHDDHLKMAEFMKVSGDSMHQAEVLYKMFDMDHNGDFTPDDMKMIFKKFDANGDGIVVYAEFLKVEEQVFKMMMQ